MADTIGNIVVPANTPVDLYDATGITIGTQISVKMIGNGNARLFSGVLLSGQPDNTTGYTPMREDEELANDDASTGAWIWSNIGCTVNVGEFTGSVIAGGF